MARCGPRSKRTPEEVYTAVEATELIGLRGTSRLTGIPLTTLHDWKELEKEGTLEEFIKEKCPASGEDLSLIRQQNRAVFVERAMTLALTILAEMESKVSEASFKDLATSFGILLDKILLMTGHPTARTETIKSVDREDLLQAVREISEKVKVLPPQRRGNKQ